jgi:hypothetical protein
MEGRRAILHRDEEFVIMGLIPPTITGKIGFFRSKNTPWAANSTAIGTTTGAVTSLATKVATAQTRLDEQVAAQESAKNATVALHEAVHDMVAAGADIIRQIRTKAALDGNAVYTLAEIPPPATPTPVGPPGTPTDFRVALNPDGSIKMTWKCANPAGASGTIYQVARRTGATGPFVALTSVGTRSLTDPTVPAGTASVTYRITAVRSTSVGVAAEFTVNFGTGSSGEMIASVVSVGGAAAPKLAA